MGYKHLDEDIIAAEFKGKKMNMERVNELCWDNHEDTCDYPGCNEYIYANDEYMDDEELVEQFKVSDTLIDKWRYDGIDYSIYMYIKDAVLEGIFIYKEAEENNGHFKPTYRDCNDPTQEELRLTRRIIKSFLDKK